MVWYLYINSTVAIEPDELLKMGKKSHNRLQSLVQEGLKCRLDLVNPVQLMYYLTSKQLDLQLIWMRSHSTWQERQLALLL